MPPPLRFQGRVSPSSAVDSFYSVPQWGHPSHVHSGDDDDDDDGGGGAVALWGKKPSR